MNTVNIFENAILVIDAESGFAYAESADCKNLFQVCCEASGSINFDDCGWSWGICGDYNFSIYSGDYDDVKVIFDQFRAKFE